MNALIEAAGDVLGYMQHNNWRACLIGGLAVQYWGEPRTTLDVDITLLTGWGDEAQYVDGLFQRFESRIAEGRQFALENRVVLIRAANGKDIDVALGALPFEHAMIDRAVQVPFAPQVVLPCCTAEDLIVMKLFAARPRDVADAESVIARQSRLDTAYMQDQLTALFALRDDSSGLDQAMAVIRSIP